MLCASIEKRPRPAALGAAASARSRGRRGRDALRRCATKRLIAGPSIWARLDALPLVEDQAEIDRLGDQQGQRHHQSDLADQALGQEAPHSRRTSAASM